MESNVPTSPQRRVWVPPRWVRALVRPVGGRPALLIELLLFWMFFQYFSFAQENIRGERNESIRHAQQLYDLEQQLHINIEPWLNQTLSQVSWLAQAAGYYYGLVLATVPATLVWVWWANPHGFRRLRRLLIVATLPSLLVFWQLPMAPPRFAVNGIIDINAVYNIMGGRLARDPSRSANLYAALPSLHVAWSMWVGYALFSTFRRRKPTWARIALLYPVVTAWDVMATGNHFVLDVVGGLALVGFGLLWVALMRGAEEKLWPSPIDRDEDLPPARAASRPALPPHAESDAPEFSTVRRT